MWNKTFFEFEFDGAKDINFKKIHAVIDPQKMGKFSISNGSIMTVHANGGVRF